MVRVSILVCAGLLLIAPPAYAYVGPGMGVGTIGVILGILFAIFIALFTVIWYPVKRAIKRQRARKKEGRPKDRAGETTIDSIGHRVDD